MLLWWGDYAHRHTDSYIQIMKDILLVKLEITYFISCRFYFPDPPGSDRSTLHSIQTIQVEKETRIIIKRNRQRQRRRKRHDRDRDTETGVIGLLYKVFNLFR